MLIIQITTVRAVLKKDISQAKEIQRSHQLQKNVLDVATQQVVIPIMLFNSHCVSLVPRKGASGGMIYLRSLQQPVIFVSR